MMQCNIIHRTSGNDLESLQFQQDTAHEFGLNTTILVTYKSMLDDEIMDYCKEQQEKFKDEIGIHFHALKCEDYISRFETPESAIYLHTFEMKKEIISYMFEKFKSLFGYYPKSIGSYYFDAQTLQWIKDNYSSVKISIINCFEEGVHMYTGTNNSWYLFSEGVPWTAYYPSKENSMCPAKDAKEAIGIIGVPHLNRDMLMSYTSRDDYYSSHTANMQRGKINDGENCSYLYKFLEQWMEQDKYNENTYYNIFVGAGWLKEGTNFEENQSDSRALYKKALSDYRKKQDEGRLITLTMGEYADWHEKNVQIGACEVNLWKDILCGSKRELFWAVNPFFRMTIDPNMGGAIVDLRPYVGRLIRNPGSDTECMWDGSYPFSISNEHRYCAHTCKLSYNNETVDLCETRTVSSVKRYSHEVVLDLEPVVIFIGDMKIMVKSTFTFENSGRVLIDRKIISTSKPDIKIKIVEEYRGCYGTTQYPEDLKGVIMYTKDNKQEINNSMNFEYKGRQINIHNPRAVGCSVPQLNTRIELEPYDTCDFGKLEEGYMFHPFYTMSLEKTVKEGENVKSWLKIMKKD